MKNFSKKIVGLLLVVALSVTCVFAFTGCNKEKDANTLYVATSADFPPYENDVNGEIVGFDVDFANAIAKKIGYKNGAKFTNTGFDPIIPAIQTGLYDVGIAGMSITEERKKMVDFSIPYIDASQVIAYKGEKKNFANEDEVIEFLKGKTIYVAGTYTGNRYLNGLVEDGKLKESDFVKDDSCDGGYALFQQLNSDKCDVIIFDKKPAEKIAVNFDNIIVDDTNLGEEEYAIVIKKGNTELLEKINKAIKELKESGEFDKLVEKHFN